MGWRVVYIQSSSKLSLNLDSLQVRYYNEKFNINLDEIECIVVEDYRCSLTARLLSKVCEEGINIVFCNNEKMPVGALHSFNNNSRTAKYSKIQLNFNLRKKALLWKEIIEIKIKNQLNVLDNNMKNSHYLEKYLSNVLIGDQDNKEGQAARIYFKELFGKDFTRGGDNIVNYCLNYTYQIIRSRLAQEIVNRGFNPSHGLYHKSEYNYFNLADDLIEVYRPLVDQFVINILKEDRPYYLTPIIKEKLLGIYEYKIKFGEAKMKLSDSIKYFLNQIVDIYNAKANHIEKFPTLNIE